MPYPQQQINTGSFVPTTNVWDVQDVYAIENISPQLRELLVRLYQNLNLMATVLNAKDSSYYVPIEFVNSQQFFNPNDPNPLNTRADFRLLVNIGALGAGATSVAHGLPISATWTFTRIYGAASDATGLNYYPLPFASAGGANNIELRVNGTNVIVTNNSGVAFTRCYVILEYLKN